MKKPNITGGQWKVVTEKSKVADWENRFVVNDDDQFVCDCGPTGHTSIDTDARFIAAAPSMAEALLAMLEAYAPFHQESVNHKGSEDGLHSAVRAARAALILAGYTEGGES